MSRAGYPNRDALRQANDIYLDAMYQFIKRCLGKVQGTTAEVLITKALGMSPHDDIEEIIEISDIAHLVRTYWYDSFEAQFEVIDPYYEARSAIGLIVEGRNRASHPPWDLDPGFTRTQLFLIAELLSKINKPNEQREVETIQDDLFSDDTAERLAEAEERLKNVEAENAEYKKSLTEVEEHLETAKSEKIKYEKDNATLSKQIDEDTIKLDEKEKRLKKLSKTAIKDVSKTAAERVVVAIKDVSKTAAERVVAAIETHNELSKASTHKTSEPKRSTADKFREANTLEDRVEIGRKVAELRINAAGSKPMSWAGIRKNLGLKNDEFHKVIRLEDHFRESVVERIESFENGWEYGGKLEVLLGFKPVGELFKRIEACKPTPKG